MINQIKIYTHLGELCKRLSFIFAYHLELLVNNFFREYFADCDNPDIKVKISKNNLLLRGSTIRNVDYVDGVVIYTGHQTKMMLNAQGPR